MSQSPRQNSSSSFVFGLIIGAIIGAIIAVVIYRQNKGKIFDDLQKKLEDFFKNLIGQKETQKPSPQKVITPKPEKTSPSPQITFVRKVAPKTFIKSKK